MKNRGPYKKDPYVNAATGGYCVAINTLVFHLHTSDCYSDAEFKRDLDTLDKMDFVELESLYFTLNLNMHTSTLAAQLSQGDYDYQVELIKEALKEWRKYYGSDIN